MYKELLDRMIDDRLEEQQADKAHIGVTPEEIDRGIANIASQAQAAARSRRHDGRRPRRGPPARPDRARLPRRDQAPDPRGQAHRAARAPARARHRSGRPVGLPALGQRGQRAGDRRRTRPALGASSRGSHSQQQQTIDAARDLAIASGRRRRGLLQARRAVQRRPLEPPLVRLARAAALRDAPPAIQDAVRAVKPGSVSDPIPVNIGQEEAIVLVMPLGAGARPDLRGREGRHDAEGPHRRPRARPQAVARRPAAQRLHRRPAVNRGS